MVRQVYPADRGNSCPLFFAPARHRITAVIDEEKLRTSAGGGDCSTRSLGNSGVDTTAQALVRGDSNGDIPLHIGSCSIYLK